MARLNEPPIVPQPSAENIEAIKRRFLRQNRELAKINSQQSIRIRSLENDCSRLLAENLSLRENVLQLQNTVESRPTFDHIDSVATQLEAKIQEIGGLVAGLARIKRNNEKVNQKSQTAARRRSGEPRQWRSGLGLQDVENGMLPTITEDKFFPRRTMGADELRQVLDEPDSQSPDIGPPPVSRYDNEQSISFNPEPTSADAMVDNCDDEEPVLPVNLETRKKRRESGPKLNIRRVSVFESPEEKEEETTKSIRTGAKRKFNVQGDEEKEEPKGESFRFNRRNIILAPDESLNKDSRSASPQRPVLGAKPVNTDPMVSPKKQRSSAQEKPDKPNLSTLKSRNRARINITRNAVESELPPLQMPEPIEAVEIMLDSLPPKTPAVEEIFSPPSTEPSTQRPESKDTPPPGDLSSSDQTGQGGRPGRRARPQVSYKEPSLHTKMRRPDAKLVDAVVERRKSVEPQTTLPASIKRETNGDLSWKPVSNVSGRGGEEEGEGGSPLRQKLDRRETSQDVKPPAPSTQPEERSTASKAISALINETSTAKRKLAASSAPAASGAPSTSSGSLNRIDSKRETTTTQSGPEKDSLAIFDFPDPSSAEVPGTRITDLAKAARNARRHSSVPASSAITSSSLEDRKPRKAEGALTSLHRRTGSGTVKSTTSTSLKSTSVSNSVKSMPASKPSVKEKKSSSSEAPLIDNNSIDVKVSMSNEVVEKESASMSLATGNLRAERAASRRKSMMI